MAAFSFQSLVLKLSCFWAEQGCVILQPYDLEMGAATSHPFTALYALGPKPWKAAFVQPCRRPTDGRYGENPNRFQRFHQFQVMLKPAPENVQALLLSSYAHLGIDLNAHDIRFVQDDWENPSLGAAGVGWEVWLDGMEITQFTYFQQMGGRECEVICAELAYGMERIALSLQNKESVFDVAWNEGEGAFSYGGLFLKSEQQFSHWYFNYAPVEAMKEHFHGLLEGGHALLEKNLTLPAYDHYLQASHAFNVLEARGAISVSQRAESIGQLRRLASQCCHQWDERNGEEKYA